MTYKEALALMPSGRRFVREVWEGSERIGYVSFETPDYPGTGGNPALGKKPFLWARGQASRYAAPPYDADANDWIEHAPTPAQPVPETRMVPLAQLQALHRLAAGADAAADHRQVLAQVAGELLAIVLTTRAAPA